MIVEDVASACSRTRAGEMGEAMLAFAVGVSLMLSCMRFFLGRTKMAMPA